MNRVNDIVAILLDLNESLEGKMPLLRRQFPEFSEAQIREMATADPTGVEQADNIVFLCRMRRADWDGNVETMRQLLGDFNYVKNKPVFTQVGGIKDLIRYQTMTALKQHVDAALDSQYQRQADTGFPKNGQRIRPGALLRDPAWKEIKTPAEMLEYTPWGQGYLAQMDYTGKRRIRGETDVRGAIKVFQDDLKHGVRIFYHFDSDQEVDYGLWIVDDVIRAAGAPNEVKPFKIDLGFLDTDDSAITAGEEWKGQDYKPAYGSEWDTNSEEKDLSSGELFGNIDPKVKSKIKSDFGRIESDSDWRLNDDEYIDLGQAIQRGTWPNGDPMTPEEKIAARRRMKYGRNFGNRDESRAQRVVAILLDLNESLESKLPLLRRQFPYTDEQFKSMCAADPTGVEKADNIVFICRMRRADWDGSIETMRQLLDDFKFVKNKPVFAQVGGIKDLIRYPTMAALKQHVDAAMQRLPQNQRRLPQNQAQEQNPDDQERQRLHQQGVDARRREEEAKNKLFAMDKNPGQEVEPGKLLLAKLGDLALYRITSFEAARDIAVKPGDVRIVVGETNIAELAKHAGTGDPGWPWTSWCTQYEQYYPRYANSLYAITKNDRGYVLLSREGNSANNIYNRPIHGETWAEIIPLIQAAAQPAAPTESRAQRVVATLLDLHEDLEGKIELLKSQFKDKFTDKDIREIAQADPTSPKQADYVTWLLRMRHTGKWTGVGAGDVEEMRELLRQYNVRKNTRSFIAHGGKRDIGQYNNVEELAQHVALDKAAGVDEETAKAGTEGLNKIGPLVLFKITNFEAARKIATEPGDYAPLGIDFGDLRTHAGTGDPGWPWTGWCTQIERHYNNYLAEPLYTIKKGKHPYVQVSFYSNQAMDIKDEPINSATVDEIAPLFAVPEFRRFVPQRRVIDEDRLVGRCQLAATQFIDRHSLGYEAADGRHVEPTVPSREAAIERLLNGYTTKRGNQISPLGSLYRSIMQVVINWDNLTDPKDQRLKEHIRVLGAPRSDYQGAVAVLVRRIAELLADDAGFWVPTMLRSLDAFTAKMNQIVAGL